MSRRTFQQIAENTMMHAVDETHELESIRLAADKLVDAFARHDVEAYFACFAPDSSFVFHTVPMRLECLADFRNQWLQWEKDGFRVQSCVCSDRRIECFGEIAIVSHSVHTELEFGAQVQSLNERETIVFRKAPDTGWTAIHEHLSMAPP